MRSQKADGGRQQHGTATQRLRKPAECGRLPYSALRPLPSALCGGTRRRRGTVLVTAIWASIAMTGIILVMARTTKVELTSAGNRVSAVQAGAVERAAEQYVLSLVEAAAGDPSAAVDAPAECMIVGGGYFWLMKPYPDDETQMAYGLVDEASKLGINDADEDSILKLPGMTQDFADAIIDWRDTDQNVTNQGAEDDYYLSLPQPYRAKNDRLETVEELMLVKGYTDEIMWGLDANRNGVLDEAERGTDGPSAMYNAANGAGRGIGPFVTVYSAEAASTNPGQGGPGGGGAGGGGTGGGTSTVARGKVNVNTAPKEVLACLPGLEQTDVDKLVSARGGTGSTTSTSAADLSWVTEAIGEAKAARVLPRLTTKSYQYSADIVAITGDGRSFKRVRVVVDGRTSPAKIVFRKELTDLGWPLDENLRKSLREGKQLQQPYGTGGGSSLGSGL